MSKSIHRSAVVIGFLVGFTSLFLPSIKPAPQQSIERVVTKLRRKEPPVKIKTVRTRKGVVELEKHFDGDDDWFNGLTINVENTSGKTITYLDGGFLFPRGLNDVQPDSPPRYHRFMYGRKPQVHYDAASSNQPINIKPGEVLDISILQGEYDSIRQQLKKLGYPVSIREIKINIEEIYFDDGTAWISGSWYQRDSNDPAKYNRIKKPQPSSRIRFNPTSETSFAVVKAAFNASPTQGGQCWADDAFYYISCDSASPSNCWKRKAAVKLFPTIADPRDTKLLTVSDDCRTEMGSGPNNLWINNKPDSHGLQSRRLHTLSRVSAGL